MTRAVEKAGLKMWPQPWHALRDYRVNELKRLGFRSEEISAWCGNSEETRSKHYSATAVTAEDRKRASAQTQTPSAQIVPSSDDCTGLNGLVLEALKKPDSRLLVEKLFQKLIQADSGELVKLASYTREESHIG